jgi:DNA-binding NtrC family response regulator
MRLLIADDDARVRESLADALQRPGLEIVAVPDGFGALAILEEDPPDLILAALRMPGVGGLEVLRRARARDPSPAVILTTAYADMPTAMEAIREGALDFLVKPLDLRELRSMVDDYKARGRPPLRARPSPGPEPWAVPGHLGPSGIPADTGSSVVPGNPVPSEAPGHPDEYLLHRLVYGSSSMKRAVRIATQAAASRVNLLIRGERGTGKEFMARAIHRSSPAASEPFVSVPCSGLPPHLLDSELFGHAEGAFPGALADREGQFQAAGSGTLFLDEVGEMPLELQAKLMRVVEAREFYPLGADRPRRTEARIMASTGRDLEGAVQEKRFRADLYFHLRELEIRVPALRDRKGDIPELAGHLLRKVGRILGRPSPSLSPDALGRLLAHDWPGNVRELKNVLMQAAVLAVGDSISGQHLDLSGGQVEGRDSLRGLEELEAEHVLRVLECTHWHKTRSAQILGVSRPRLNRLIEKHGLG